ncbi:PH, RCC1 and FYVE domains-containing protein 1-like [Apium graveolens]|uniref:PH, RCC1 and FYVE domains-containing protein 1-like n=1 Tax=Apium graveolens TaxID=4045 RepID=UPI003D7922DD
MTIFQSNSLGERDAEQAITALKRGSYLLKYGHRGNPKFCPFRLSNDETSLIWYTGTQEKEVQLRHVSRIIPGQRTAIFHRYPRPEKEYESFSLIYNKGSLDLICKDKDEAEIWFVALSALLSRGNCQELRRRGSSDSLSSTGSSNITKGHSQSFTSRSGSDRVYEDQENTQSPQCFSANLPQKRLGRALSELLLYDSAARFSPRREFDKKSLSIQSSQDLNDRNQADTSRHSISSAINSSDPGSPQEDVATFGDVFIWGEGINDGLIGGGVHRTSSLSSFKDALSPKVLGPVLALNTKEVSCGSKHAVLVTKQGKIYSWGEGSGGRLGHGVDADVPNPKFISALCELEIKSVSCGENHTIAITESGDLYTWGDGIHSCGLLGHGNDFSQWIPKRVSHVEGIHVSVISCGPWHSAVVTETGLLLTFGDGTFGALGHGDRCSTNIPREVEALKGLRVVTVSCGVWHTAAVVDITSSPPNCNGSPSGHLFTWGNGNKGQLGHGDDESKLVPSCVLVSNDINFCQVACGHSITVALTTLGKVYTMGSAKHGQLGSPGSPGKLPICIEGELRNNFIGEIACGSNHVAVLSSNSEVYTWGKGTNGQLGHGDLDDRSTPTLVKALKRKQIKSVVCGSNITAVICDHKQASIADYHMCSSCHAPFYFRRKRHNCYNCGLVFCKVCSSKKSLNASLAPNTNKLFRVCEVCFSKLNKAVVNKSPVPPPQVTHGNTKASSGESKEQETPLIKSNSVISKLSSFNSFRRLSNSQSKKSMKKKLNSGHISPIANRSLGNESSSTSHSSPSVYECSQNASPLSCPIVNSLTSSPVSVTSSPSRPLSLTSNSAALAYPYIILDESKKTNDNLSNEISILRQQVEVLTHKSQLLEAELGKKSNLLKEATDIIGDEKARNKVNGSN